MKFVSPSSYLYINEIIVQKKYHKKYPTSGDFSLSSGLLGTLSIVLAVIHIPSAWWVGASTQFVLVHFQSGKQKARIVVVFLVESHTIPAPYGQEQSTRGCWEMACDTYDWSRAPTPGNLPSAVHNLKTLSQDTCRAKTRHPTKTGACGDILVRAKPPMGLELCQEPHTHEHAHTLKLIQALITPTQAQTHCACKQH